MISEMTRGVRRLEGPIDSEWATSFEEWGKKVRTETNNNLLEIETNLLSGDKSVNGMVAETVAFSS